MLAIVSLCLLALASGAQSECVDYLPRCDMLEEIYCYAPYESFAKDVCAKRCGLCDDNSSMNKRSHNHGPDWADHCWDNNANHVMDPFCALLTTTTTPKPTTPTTTTTPKPTTTTTTEPTTTTTEPTTTTTEPTTTTTEPTTTTTEPTTTTTEPTTTTTEPTTTTTEPTTTTTEPTTTLPPTTTQRSCYYLEYNETDIKTTDWGTDVALVQNTNITLNESVHLIGDVDFCQGVCAQSLLNDGFECWAFTYNEIDRCYLYYYTRPLQLLDHADENVTTTLYVKRCSDDPTTTRRMTTPEPILTTPVPMVTTEPPTTSTTMGSPPTMAPDTTVGTAPPTMAPDTTVGTAPPTMAPDTTVGTAPPTQAPDTTMAATTDGAPPLMTTGTTAAVVTDNNSGTNTGPDTSKAPSGVLIVSANTYKINGVPSPVKDTCFFLNQTFAKGEHWKDTCKYDCECFDTATNVAMCTDVCPHFTNIPAGCQIVQDDGQCCARMDCGNQTQVNTTIDGSGNVSNCDNTIDTCDYYDDIACVDQFEPWARAHCALRCGYCPFQEPCLDRISFCNLYDLDDACPNYRGWARHNCKRSCDMCQ